MSRINYGEKEEMEKRFIVKTHRFFIFRRSHENCSGIELRKVFSPLTSSKTSSRDKLPKTNSKQQRRSFSFVCCCHNHCQRQTESDGWAETEASRQYKRNKRRFTAMKSVIMELWSETRDEGKVLLVPKILLSPGCGLNIFPDGSENVLAKSTHPRKA